MRRLGFERSTLRSYTDGEEVPLPARCRQRRRRLTNGFVRVAGAARSFPFGGEHVLVPQAVTSVVDR
jgi:hypothetical protein